MLISSNTLRLALLRIFENAGARAGDNLLFRDIATAWTRTGLRNSDLRDAVNEMIESGGLCSGDCDGALGFSLTPKADRLLTEPDEDMRATRAEDETTLFQVQLRVRGDLDPGLRRRNADRPHVSPVS